jgi:hypothetical protein
MKSHVFLSTAALFLLVLPGLFNRYRTSSPLDISGEIRDVLMVPLCDQAPRNPPRPKKLQGMADDWRIACLDNPLRSKGGDADEVYTDDVRIIRKPGLQFRPIAPGWASGTIGRKRARACDGACP